MNQLAPIEDAPARLPRLTSGGRVAPIVPSDFEGAWRIAQAVCAAKMAPPGLDAPEKAMVAIMHGLEVGLTPMAALQSIAVVNGRPSLWGDGAMALVRASGLCEWVRERIEGDGDARAAVCEVKRRGDPEPIVGRFSVTDAKRAGLWDERTTIKRKSKYGDGGSYEAQNDAPWHRYPERMMKMRARAFALRDGFADVLRGLHIGEEMQDVAREAGDPRDVTPAPAAIAPPPPPPPPPAPPAAKTPEVEPEIPEYLKRSPQRPIEPPPAAAEPDDDARTLFFESLESAMASAESASDVAEVWDAESVETICTDPEDLHVAEAIRDRRLREIGGRR
jgi:hypothetical protein